MSLADDEILQLEEYLDGALPADEAAVVREFLATRSEWTAAADGLRADRAMREKLFAALEPNDIEANRLADRVMDAIRGERRSGRYGRLFRMSSAAAACLAVGLISGWLLRDRSIALNHPAAGGGITTVGSHSQAKVAEVVAYQVELTDEAGRVTAVQKFDSLEKAREFADDLSRWQERQRQMRNGAAVVVADRF